MEFLEEKELDRPKHTQSDTGNPVREKISGGYNTYDNILKLVDVRVLDIVVPTFTLIEGSGVSSGSDSFYHELGRTPFVEVEWRDPSSVGSGNTIQYYVDCTFNDLTVEISAGVIYNNFGMEPDPEEVIPSFEIPLTVYVYDLNTKQRLDTYLK